MCGCKSQIFQVRLKKTAAAAKGVTTMTSRERMIAAIHHQGLCPSSALGSHESEIRNAVVILRPVVARLFFEIITTSVTDLKIRRLIMYALGLVLVTAEEL
jgi:hypothetical protein